MLVSVTGALSSGKKMGLIVILIMQSTLWHDYFICEHNVSYVIKKKTCMHRRLTSSSYFLHVKEFVFVRLDKGFT